VDATDIALRTVRQYLDEGKADPTKLQKVVFCVWSDKDRDVYQCARVFPDHLLPLTLNQKIARQRVPLYFPPPATNKAGEDVVNTVVHASVGAEAGGGGGESGGGGGDGGGGAGGD
jgi:uncharacterized membrane protein YgcG